MGKLDYRTLRENVADEIRMKILNGDMKPGDKIIEQELASEFGISRGPVREALRQLEQEGMVEYSRNVGCSVKHIGMDDVYEIYYMRANYEMMAVRLYNAPFPRETIEKMEQVLEQMKQLHKEEYRKVFELDNEFHEAILDLVSFKRLKKAWEEEMEGLGNYACYQAFVPCMARGVLLEKLDETGMRKVYDEIELPLVFTLDSMEKWGISVKGEELKSYGEKLKVRIQELEKTIWQEAGEEFNINSPKQLGVILFEKMGLPGGKKTKTGYSTAADILDKLAPDHAIVKDILEYRQLTKLKSTYADGLGNVIGEDGRIHSTFNQTITATGRISSTDPNLQNIPVRMELGRLIRKVFVPEEGFVFLDADYSQIELRVLAHMSGDEKLIQAYREAEDIHRLTASQVFHVPLDEVTPLQRRNAKAVNFGIVYGISSFGLSQDLSITRKEAAAYIEKYFETYPKIKGFLDGLVKDGKEHGYVTTMFGRRRPVPELKSSNFMQRSFGERVAMNSPIQGTAADIIKIAMNHVYERMKKEGLCSRLVLQVHDELLIETKKEEIEIVSRILEEEMKGAADLAVELDVDMHQGDSWYEAK